MKQRNNNWIKNQYKESWNFIKLSGNYIYIIIGVFLLFAFAGFAFPTPDFLAGQIIEFIEELSLKTAGLETAELIWFIFANNLQSGFFGMMLGFFFGVFSVLFSVANGYVLGFVASLVISEQGAFVLWKLLPHGVFELPAIFISLGLGMKFGTFIFRKKKAESFRIYFWNCLRVFVFVVLPLLAVAAVIEGILIGAVNG